MIFQSSIRLRLNRAVSAGTSCAALAVALAATPALADSSAAPEAVNLLGEAGLEVSVQRASQGTYWQAGNAAQIEAQARTVNVSVTAPDPQILIANPGTPTTARDPVRVTGVGQMFVNNGGGSIGLCTGTLINARTVIFAAHCVNSRAAGAYGNTSGGTPIAFGFETYTRPNASGQPDELLNWFNGGSTGPGVGKTNVAQALYNSNYVAYNPLSTEPNAASFLYGDVAIATLDTPAANVPTWALLFSQLPAVPITANGTGYHVSIIGYGNNGTGEAGAYGGIDFRRRVAENTLGALASLDEFENFLFGSTSTDNPQNLYWIDFDDPRRGTATASPYDFNAWRDNALPNEGLTSGGDSGGPLVLDRAFAKSVVLGVLSGGYTRFYNGQPANSYGTAAFYQPLYLYWDWIAQNNPFHYVGSIAGNADWTDPTHWVTNLDPSYQIIVNGQLVNGIPTSPGTGNTETPGFGQACFQDTTSSQCFDVASGTVDSNANPIGTAANNAGQADMALAPEAAQLDSNGLVAIGSGRPTGGTLESQAGTLAIPAATLANGLPGATNFVPSNYDGDRVARVMPRYFDVTLGASGTTTLGSAVVIDRFTISNAGASLNIGTAGSLTSLISITQMTGTMQVNGALSTPGDYFMMTGGLNGTGIITTPFFTSVAGTISPGAVGNVGNVGTLTFRGNTIFASGTTLMIDLGATGVNDRVVVQANGATGGVANLGGAVIFSINSGTMPRAGDTYTFLTAQNGVTGAFTASASLSAILRPTLIYSPNAVAVQITAGTYASVVDPSSAVQTSYASLMDGNRAGYSGPLAGLYGPLDLQSQSAIRAFFESAAPRTESLRTASGVVATGTTDRFFRQRIHAVEPGSSTGKLAVIGRPLNLASSNGVARMAAPADAGLGYDTEGSMSAAKLPDSMSGYLAAGYLNGNSAPMPAMASSGRDTFDGWFVAGGLETALGDNATGGFGLSYAKVDGTTGGAPQTAGSSLIQGTIYVAIGNDKGLRADARFSAGLLSTNSSRTVTLVATPYTLTLDDDSLAITAEAGLGFDLAKSASFSVVPRVSLRYENIGFDKSVERGGPMAMVYDRDAYEALEGRAGISFSGKGGKVRPFLEASYVHDFMDQPTTFGASFAGGGAIAPFALAGTDNDWAEVSGGIAIDLGAKAEIALEADTTVMRDDFRNQSYRARVTVRF